MQEVFTAFTVFNAFRRKGMEHVFDHNLRFYYERSGYIMTGRDFHDDV